MSSTSLGATDFVTLNQSILPLLLPPTPCPLFLSQPIHAPSVMQFLALLTSLLFVSASVAYKSINPVLSDGKGHEALHDIDRKPVAARAYSAAYPRTNAERLARGLPLLKARFKWNKPGRLSQGPSRVERQWRTFSYILRLTGCVCLQSLDGTCPRLSQILL